MSIHPTVCPFAGCFRPPKSQRETALVFVGLPDDSQSSYRRGCALGPERIRQAYDGHSYHAVTECGVDLTGCVLDLGDWPTQGSWSLTAETYRQGAEELLRAGKVPFFAGGDHAVTVPIGEALAVLGMPIHVVQIDAHADLYPEYEGSRTSHACMAARLLEMPHVASITQIGIRTLNPIQAEQIRAHQERLHLFLARDVQDTLPRLAHIPDGVAVYLTVDLDGLDPAFAPGVSHPVPGGLSSRQVLTLIQRARWKLVGMDVVELNPTRDVHDLTAILAGRLLHEGMGYSAHQ